MFESIKKIIKKSQETGKDIGVACDMLVHDGEDLATMKKAMDIYEKSYEEICYFTVKNDYEMIEKIVKLTEEKKYSEIRELMKEIRGE